MARYAWRALLTAASIREPPRAQRSFRSGGFCGILTSKIGATTMASYATTRLSSKGQVVIPEEIRNDLGLSEGDQFVVIGEGDSVILKTITPPRIEEFHKLLSQARSAAKRAGSKRADLKSAIAKVRHRTK